VKLSPGVPSEADTLARWVEHSPVIEAAEVYDQLRESLTAAYADWRDARKRGWRAEADADKALQEIIDLTALLEVIVDTLAYRRGEHLAHGRAWPLSGLESL
jgi:hypothetical protein